MNYKRFMLLFSTVFIVQYVVAQNMLNEDSLLQVYRAQKDSEQRIETLSHLYNATLYSDPQKALKYAREELSLAKKLENSNGIADGLYHIGVFYSNTQDLDSARIYYLKASPYYEASGNVEGQTSVNHGLAIVEYSLGNYNKAIGLLNQNIEIYSNPENDPSELNPSMGLAIAYDLMGQIHMFKGNHNIALKHNLEALRYFEEINEPLRKADALNHVAAIESYLENHDKSISYNKEACRIYQEYNDKLFAANAMNDIGNAYFYLEAYDSAITYLELSLVLSKEMNSSDLIGTTTNNLGKVYARKGVSQKAISLLSEALQIHDKNSSKSKIIESLNDLGIVHNQIDLPENAILYFNRAINMAEEIESKESLKIGYYNRSESYEELHNYAQALEDFKVYKTIEDSIFNTDKSQQIEELRAIYETDRKEKEIAIQKNEIALLKQKEKINTLQRALLGGGLGLTTLILGLGFYALRQKIKRNHLEMEKLDADLEFKKKELTSHALHLAHKNEVLEELKEKVEAFRRTNHEPKKYNQLIQTINFNLQNDNNWENFKKYFEEVHKDFNSIVKQKYPSLSSNELRLIALLKMNLSSKEIANLLNISSEGIKKARYRLRKKMNISTDESLQGQILSM
jgi:tetratricopeptide (TPR) repeat protein/DNA-binding CsgD family transcriptional regulator